MTALIQQTPEWLEMRKSKIGASDAPVIMGVSPWTTAYQLWETKLGIREEKKATPRMKEGLEKEDIARKLFEKITELIVIPQVVFHPDKKWMMASLDGMDLEQKHIVEIKCPNLDDHKIAKKGQIPEKYYPQLQHQLEVTGLDMAYYFSYYEYLDGEELKQDYGLVECKRNSKYMRKLLNEEEEFYQCMQDFIAPKLSTKDYEHKTDEVWQATALEWLETQKQLRKLEMRDKELHDILISLSRGQNSSGGGVRVCQMIRKGTIDYGKIPELKGLDLDKYRKETIKYWKISKG